MTQLRALHQQYWDSSTNLLKTMPGAALKGAVSETTHSVRESALGAYLDFIDGEHDRANMSINILSD